MHYYSVFKDQPQVSGANPNFRGKRKQYRHVTGVSTLRCSHAPDLSTNKAGMP
jgi:hypothetical protein